MHEHFVAVCAAAPSLSPQIMSLDSSGRHVAGSHLPLPKHKGEVALLVIGLSSVVGVRAQ